MSIHGHCKVGVGVNYRQKNEMVDSWLKVLSLILIDFVLSHLVGSALHTC